MGDNGTGIGVPLVRHTQGVERTKPRLYAVFSFYVRLIFRNITGTSSGWSPCDGLWEAKLGSEEPAVALKRAPATPLLPRRRRMPPKGRSATCRGLNVQPLCQGCALKSGCLFTEHFKKNSSWRPPPITRSLTTTRLRETTPGEPQQQESEPRGKRQRFERNLFSQDADALRDQVSHAKKLQKDRQALKTAPVRKRRRQSVLTDVPEDEDLDEATQLRTELQDAKDRVEELEEENQELRRALEDQKKGLKLGLGRRETDKTPTKEEIDDLASWTDEGEMDIDEEDAQADEAMDDERGLRPTGGPGRPFHVPVKFDSNNVTQFNETQLCHHLESNKIFVRDLMRICQGSVGKLRQICDRLLQRYDSEGYGVKIAVFDRVKAAIDLLKAPPTGYQLFADKRRKELLDDDFEDRSESEIQKQIGRDWKALGKEEQEKQNKDAREKDPRHYALSAKASEANRKRYVFALTLVAPPKCRSTDPTSLVPKIARAFGLSPKSTAWETGINQRGAIDDPFNSEATWEITRKKRSDALSPATVSLVEKHWDESTTPSPSERDQKRHRIGPNKYVSHQIHEQHKKTRALLADYNTEHPENYVCYGIYQSLKPYYVRLPGVMTCLCRYCENIRQLQKALLLNRKLFLDLDAVRRAAGLFLVKWIRWRRGLSIEEARTWRRPRGVGAISVASLLSCDKKSDLLRLLCCPVAVDSVALMDARLPVGANYNVVYDSAKGKYVRRDDDADPGDVQGAVDVALKSRQKFIQSREVCMGCGQDDCEKCGDIDRRLRRDCEFEKQLWGPLDEPTVKIKWSSYRTEEDDDGNSKSDNELHRKDDHPSKFLDEFFAALEQYKRHYLYLKRQKRAHRDQERNFLINQMLQDMDFAENFTIMLSFEIQSAHWINKQVTIFISIVQHLDKDCWDSRDSSLEKDTDVTVEPADGTGEKFWARVVESSPAGADIMVKLVDGKGTKLTRPRKLLRHRKIISVAHIQVSNDKDHDTWFVQKAMQDIWNWYKGDGDKMYPGLANRIESELMRSDGAGSHFKNKTTYHYLGHYADANKLLASWDVGCPGHGYVLSINRTDTSLQEGTLGWSRRNDKTDCPRIDRREGAQPPK